MRLSRRAKLLAELIVSLAIGGLATWMLVLFINRGLALSAGIS